MEQKKEEKEEKKKEKVIILATEQAESCSSTGGFNILEHNIKKWQIKLKLMLMDEKTIRLSREEDDWHWKGQQKWPRKKD